MSARIQSIERAAAVLRLLTGRSRRRGVADLADELDLPRGTVHGILRTLKAVGFVEQDSESGKYQLGAALLHIGSSYLDGNELRRRAITWADALATQTGESVRIGTLHEHLVLIVHHVLRPDDGLQPLEIGSLLPIHATALGKVLLAHHPRLVTELAARGLGTYTSATITDADRLTAELGRVSARGWAGAIGELSPGVASIAAPIQNRRRVVIGAIAISGEVKRLCQDGSPRPEFAASVMDAARSISRELGATPW